MRACNHCGRESARDGEVSHDGKCRRALAAQYGDENGPDRLNCELAAAEARGKRAGWVEALEWVLSRRSRHSKESAFLEMKLTELEKEAP